MIFLILFVVHYAMNCVKLEYCVCFKMGIEFEDYYFVCVVIDMHVNLNLFTHRLM